MIPVFQGLSPSRVLRQVWIHKTIFFLIVYLRFWQIHWYEYNWHNFNYNYQKHLSGGTLQHTWDAANDVSEDNDEEAATVTVLGPLDGNDVNGPSLVRAAGLRRSHDGGGGTGHGVSENRTELLLSRCVAGSWPPEWAGRGGPSMRRANQTELDQAGNGAGDISCSLLV